MTHFRSLADIRREYGELCLHEGTVHSDPVAQFKAWFEDVLLNEKNDPTAMVLSTVDEKGHPDSRVVLLKGIKDRCFIFYTNYLSIKAKQLDHTPYAALNFYWPQMARQVRVRGKVEKISDADSDQYFASRPLTSQFGAIISPQSQAISDRVFLENSLNQLIQQSGQKPVLRPTFWGGYRVEPEEIEFWQGRDNRLHDRIQYLIEDEIWHFHRLAP